MTGLDASVATITGLLPTGFMLVVGLMVVAFGFRVGQFNVREPVSWVQIAFIVAVLGLADWAWRSA